MLLQAVLTIPALLVSYRLSRLTANYIAARKIGLPVIVTPFTWQDPFWITFGRKFSWIRYLPFGLGQWYKYSYMGWSLHDHFSTYDRLNTKAFTLVSPRRNEIMLADASAVTEVLGKYRKWRRPRELYAVFATYGENVDCCDGDDWQRHRKVIGHGFREHNNQLVWESATKQTRQWMASWKGQEKERSIRVLEQDVNTISANVLMFAGFGRDYDFVDGGMKDIPKGHTKSFAEVMSFMSRNIVLAWLTRNLILPKIIEPTKLAQLREAHKELFRYFDEALCRRDGDFVKSFVEANENEKNGGRQHLTKEELFGNMYIIQLAGFDTTSFTMLFTLLSLASHPEVQEWAREGTTKVAHYADTYPTAIRYQAIIHETLRVYGSAPTLARYSPNTEAMTISGREIAIPANTYVSANFTGCHYDPDVWGEDVAKWKPQRWIEVIDGKERLKKSSDLLAWSAGPRICPGKKFSLVEITAVMSTLLQEYRLVASPGLQDALEDFEFRGTPKIKRSVIDAECVNLVPR